MKMPQYRTYVAKKARCLAPAEFDVPDDPICNLAMSTIARALRDVMTAGPKVAEEAFIWVMFVAPLWLFYLQGEIDQAAWQSRIEPIYLARLEEFENQKKLRKEHRKRGTK
jgi:hypothetical protein